MPIVCGFRFEHEEEPALSDHLISTSIWEALGESPSQTKSFDSCFKMQEKHRKNRREFIFRNIWEMMAESTFWLCWKFIEKLGGQYLFYNCTFTSVNKMARGNGRKKTPASFFKRSYTT